MAKYTIKLLEINFIYLIDIVYIFFHSVIALSLLRSINFINSYEKKFKLNSYIILCQTILFKMLKKNKK
jgi:hypothetical protein